MNWFRPRPDVIRVEVRVETPLTDALLSSICDQLSGISRNQEIIMALVQVDQSVLDGFGEALGTIADSVQALVDDPANPVTLDDANVSAITSAIERLQGELAKPTEPTEPATDAPEGDAPATEQPATDGEAPATSDEDSTSV